MSGQRRPRVDIVFERGHQPDPRVRRISHALDDAGYRVRVLAWDRTGLLPAIEDDHGVEVRRVHVRSHNGRGPAQLLYLVRAVARYLPLIRADRPDVLHAVDLPMLLAVVLMAPFAGRPRIVYDAFEIYSIMEAHKYPGWLLAAIGGLERILPRFADVVLTVGEGRRAWFATRGIRSTVVANWIDPPADPPTRAAARRAYDIGPNRFAILYAGGLDPSRDLDPLLRHARRFPDDLILVAGSGSDEDRLMAATADLVNVRFLGFLRDPTPVTIAADALYYALRDDHPYAGHAAPNNLYVAISHGVPLLHRGQGEIGVLARGHEIGARFHDDATLDAAIDLLRDPATNERIRSSLRGLQARYSWARARSTLLSVYPFARSGTTASSPRTNGP